MSLSIVIVGASGRMGQAILRLAREDGITIAAALSEGDDLAEGARAGANVAIDFSSPEATAAFAPLAAESGMALVVGTTGLGPEAFAILERAAARVPVFIAANMSVGVALLADLVRRTAGILAGDFDVEIVEAHHRKKADAPSGTALALLDAARQGGVGADEVVYGRSGRPGPRPAREIGLHAVRGGDVIGDHHVHFLGEGERLELVHRATNRDVFARGALRAARYLVGQAPGRYGMADLVGRRGV